MRKAFTLIELLVVIAIIAILAAILFPVFTQAKVAAKKASDLSNVKQLNTSAQIYMSNVDDMMPIFFNRAGIAGPLPTGGGTSATLYRYMWQFAMHPYMKNWQIYTAPGDSPSSDKVVEAFHLSYGYNYGYLSKLCVGNDAFSQTLGCSVTEPNGSGASQWFLGQSSTSVLQPGNIIMFADNGGKDLSGTGSIVGSMVNPPDALPAYRYFYGPVGVGWCKGSQGYFQKPALATGALGTTGKAADTDGFDPRYAGGGNVNYVDGHAGWLSVSQAAVGTTWTATNTNCLNVTVTDYAKYKWDPRYESGVGQYSSGN